jgi:predicted nucleic acid-binding protein
MNPTPSVLVLDTNIVLDLFVYDDPATVPLRELLTDAQTRWLATPVMREELRRVLAYPQV